MKWIISAFCCLFFPTLAHSMQVENHFLTNPDVKAFIHEMATKYKFKEADLITLFSSVKVRPSVIQSVRTPLEKRQWYTYRLIYVTEKRISAGVKFWNTYHDALEKAEKIYGVPASIIVATIGIESKYGQNTGDYRVIDALVNLGFGDTTRTNFFRQELKEFLLLTREQHLDPLKVMGSYAGAIGQPQFMPSSYRAYAINFSGTLPIDLSHNEVDVIGSIANYYKKNGWAPNQLIVLPVSIAGGKFQFSLSRPKNLSWSQLSRNGMLSADALLQMQKPKLISLRANYGNEYWLAYRNFDVIKRYNHSDLYAMAIYQLSYYIAASHRNKS